VNAIHILEENLDRINWNTLSCNINAISILEQNLDKINWSFLLRNINIFELDLKFLKNKMDIIREELMMKIFHPLRFERYLNIGYDITDDQYIY
jgi:hypothetical protein